MSYIGSHIATVPSGNFKWYLIFLEDSFNDAIKSEIDKHFTVLGKESGRDILVARGFDASEFRKSIYETPAFYNEEWRERAKFPSLLVTNGPPDRVLQNKDLLDGSKVIIFPLKDTFKEQGTLSGFFNELLETLASEDAIAALEKMEKKSIAKWWRWLNKYSKMEPGFFGFSIDLNAILKDKMS